MNWSEFKAKVRVNLLVDADRKGRGIQNYINQLRLCRRIACFKITLKCCFGCHILSYSKFTYASTLTT